MIHGQAGQCRGTVEHVCGTGSAPADPFPIGSLYQRHVLRKLQAVTDGGPSGRCIRGAGYLTDKEEPL